MNPLARLLECFALLLLDLVVALDSHLAGLRVSHTEHIVGLDSPVDAAVARDWLTELLDRCGGVLGGFFIGRAD